MNPSARSNLDVTVTVRWGDTVLAGAKLTGKHDITVGAGPAALLPIPCASLGLETARVASMRNETPVAIVPKEVIAFHQRPGLVPSLHVGPVEIALCAGETASFEIGAFSITISAENLEQASWAFPPRKAALRTPALSLAAAAFVHAFFLGLSAQAARAETMEPESPAVETMARYLASADARTAATEQVVSGDTGSSHARKVANQDGNGKAAGGTRASGKEGRMGSASERTPSKGRYAVARSDKDSAGKTLSFAEALEDARSFGMVGLLSGDASRSPFVSFGQVAANGQDVLAARGDLWGSSISDSFGAGGLGLSGIGEGGGEGGVGIGLGRIGTFGFGLGDGGGSGGLGQLRRSLPTWGGGSYHCMYPPLPPNREPFPTVRFGVPSMQLFRGGESSKVTLQSVDRTVRGRYSAFSACFSPLHRFPSNGEPMSVTEEGTVVTQFVVGKNGEVSSVFNASSTFTASGVAACVARVFRTIEFQAPPDGGTLAVSFPVRFGMFHR